MSTKFDPNRRDLLKLMGVGGVVYASSLFPGLAGCASPKARGADKDFFFLQLSDTHWGFSGPMVNPEADSMLKNTVASINGVAEKPDFIIFTGDLTHTTDDGAVRRARMKEFQQIVGGLEGATLKFIPGEHDAAPDQGKAYTEIFGELHYSFDHKGIHFVVLDNVSSPTASLGDAQLAWLKSDLAALDPEAPIVVFTHRPLFDLFAAWDWTTADGQKAIDLLLPFKNVVVFYGHIHQENNHLTGHIPHHSAQSLMFALPAAGSQPKKAPIPWDAASPGKGLGYRNVTAGTAPEAYAITAKPATVKGG